jgi:hypothetical protein
MKKLSVFFMGLALMLLCGCAMFQNIDIVHQEVLIKAAARTGTWLGIQEGVDNIEKRQEVARFLRDDIVVNVISLLDGVDVELSAENRELLLLKIPMELRPFLGDALDILDGYMKQASLKDHLDDNAVRLLRAFFQGVIDGCDLILMRVGANYGLGNNSSDCFAECFERG